MTLYDVITHMKPVLNKDKNHSYYKIFLEKFSYQLPKIFVCSIIMEKLGRTETTKEKFYAAIFGMLMLMIYIYIYIYLKLYIYLLIPNI